MGPLLVMRTWRVDPLVVVTDGTTVVPRSKAVEAVTRLGGTTIMVEDIQPAMDPATHRGRLRMRIGAPGLGRLRRQHLDGMILVGVDIDTGIQLLLLPRAVRNGSGTIVATVVGVLRPGM